MKKYLIITVLVAMILGLVSVTGVAAGDNNTQIGGPFKTQDAVLVTVCENYELEYGDSVPRGSIDAKGYNKFKLYAYMEAVDPANFASINASYMRVSLYERATSDPEQGPYLNRSPNPAEDWIKWNPIPDTRPGHYSMVIPIPEGIYSAFNVGGMYKKSPPMPPAPPGQPPVSVSVYLLMAK